jgi:hypothetical protein
MHDLKQALQYQLEDLVSLETLGVDDVHIQDLLEVAQRRAKDEMGIILSMSSHSEPKQNKTNMTKPVAPEPEPEIDLEAFKAKSIERLRSIYVAPGGALLIDRLIRTHGGGASVFTKIAADRYPAMMQEVEKEFPSA